METRIVLLCLLLLVAGCGTGENLSPSNELSIPANPASHRTSTQRTPHDLYANGKAKLIKTSNYRFEVEDMNQATEAIETALTKYPAYISDSKLSFESTRIENRITIRILNEFFQDMLKDIDQHARLIIDRTITTDDVTKEFVDLESRLKTKREVQQRHTEILRKKAGTITELLEAEKKIGELQEEVEATISRINYLKDQVSYSTINLEFYQTINLQIASVETDSAADNFREALAAGWAGVVWFMLVIAYLWPLILLGIVTGAFYWFKKKRTLVHN